MHWDAYLYRHFWKYFSLRVDICSEIHTKRENFKYLFQLLQLNGAKTFIILFILTLYMVFLVRKHTKVLSQDVWNFNCYIKQKDFVTLNTMCKLFSLSLYKTFIYCLEIFSKQDLCFHRGKKQTRNRYCLLWVISIVDCATVLDYF